MEVVQVRLIWELGKHLISYWIFKDIPNSLGISGVSDGRFINFSLIPDVKGDMHP